MPHTPTPAAAPTTHNGRPGGFFSRKDDELHLTVANLVESNAALRDALTGLHSVAQALSQMTAVTTRRVLWSGTAVLNAEGIWSQHVGAGSRAIHVINFSTNDQVAIAADTPQGTAPGSGAGTHLLPAGAAGAFNNETTVWTLYGTPGDTFDIQIFGVPVQPGAAGQI